MSPGKKNGSPFCFGRRHLLFFFPALLELVLTPLEVRPLPPLLFRARRQREWKSGAERLGSDVIVSTQTRALGSFAGRLSNIPSAPSPFSAPRGQRLQRIDSSAFQQPAMPYTWQRQRSR